MDEYPNNSFSAAKKKPEPTKEHKEAVVTAKQKEPSFWKMFLSSFLPSDVGHKDIKEYLAKDVIAPGVKDLLYNFVCDTLHLRLYGNAASKKSSTSIFGGTTSYRSYYESNQRTVAANRDSAKPQNAMPEILYSSRKDAETVLLEMKKIIADFGTASVGDLLDLSRLVPTPTDFDFGWSNLQNADIRRSNGGFELVLPPARPIDK